MDKFFADIKCISSISDERIAFIRKLSSGKAYAEGDSFFLEGERAISEVPQHKGALKTVIVSNSFAENIDAAESRRGLIRSLRGTGAVFLRVTDKIFSAISKTVTPQGIAAVISKPDFGSVEEMLGRARRVLVLENIQDPGNLGTCIRTADAFGFDAVVLTDNCVDVYNQKVLRSTVGSLFHLPVYKYQRGMFRLSEAIKKQGIKLFGADPKAGIDSRNPEFGGERCAVIIGNEANGLSDVARAVSDSLVKIGMAGNAESLNAAIAAAVLMYELSGK